MPRGQGEPKVHVTFRNPETGELIDKIVSSGRFEDQRDALVARGWEVIESYDIALDDPPITIRVHRRPAVPPPPVKDYRAEVVGRTLLAILLWIPLLVLVFAWMSSCMKGGS